MINGTAAKFFQRTSGPCLIKMEEQLPDPGSQGLGGGGGGGGGRGGGGGA